MCACIVASMDGTLGRAASGSPALMHNTIGNVFPLRRSFNFMTLSLRGLRRPGSICRPMKEPAMNISFANKARETIRSGLNFYRLVALSNGQRANERRSIDLFFLHVFIFIKIMIIPAAVLIERASDKMQQHKAREIRGWEKILLKTVIVKIAVLSDERVTR